jgi:hypothetical protein
VRRPLKRVGIVALAAVSAAVVLSGAGTGASTASCTKTLASGGNLAEFLGTLQAGDVGCISGTYTDTSGGIVFRNAGTPSARVTLRSADPANKATITTQYIEWTASATYTGLEGVNIRLGGTLRQNGVQMHAHGAELRDCDVTVQAGTSQDRIGVSLGWSYKANDIKVIGNRIYGFGVPGSGLNHDIYDNWTEGAEIANNYIYDAGGFGLQLWTSAENGNIDHNTFYNNGRGQIVIGGDMSHNAPSSGNDVHHNILVNPADRPQVVIFWGSWNGSNGGTGNRVHDNIYWGSGEFRQDYPSPYSIAYTNNQAADPQFKNAEARDLTPTNPAAAGYGVPQSVTSPPPPVDDVQQLPAPAAPSPAAVPTPTAQPSPTAAPTTTPPAATPLAPAKVWAFKSTGFLGGLARLRVATEAKAKYSSFVVTVQSKRGTIKTIVAPTRNRGLIQEVKWQVPTGFTRQSLRFCVVGKGNLDLVSAKSCSTLALKNRPAQLRPTRR